MSRRTRPTFSPEFRHEAAQLAVDQNYSIRDAAQAMWPHSIYKCTTCPSEHPVGCLVIQTFSRPVVEWFFDAVNFLCAHFAKVRSLWEGPSD